MRAALLRASAAMRATASARACAVPTRAGARISGVLPSATAGRHGRPKLVPIRWTSLVGSRGAAAAAPSRAASSSSSPIAPTPPLLVGDEIELECVGLAFGGKRVCRLPEGFVVLCERATPGETVLAKITAVKKGGRFAEATKLAAVIDSPHAMPPDCPHFELCGGCTWQDVSYEKQLEMKRAQVLDVLRRVAKVSENDASVDATKSGTAGSVEASQPSLVEQLTAPCVPAKHTLRYRNKMEFAFGAGGGGKNAPAPVVVGLRPKGNHAGVVEVTRAGGKYATGDDLASGGCLLQHPTANAVLAAIQQHLAGTPGTSCALPVFDRRTGKGVLRSVTVRVAEEATAASASSSGDEKNKEKQASPAEVPVFAAVNVAASAVSVGSKKALLGLAMAIANVPGVHSVTLTSVSPTPELRLAEGRKQGWVRGGGLRHGHGRKNANSEDDDEVFGEVTVVHGPDTLPMRLGGVTFNVSPASFFQTNTAQAERLVQEVERACGFDDEPDETKNSKVILDLFCGVGTLGLCLAHRARSVIGWEMVPAAVADATRNAQANGIENAAFFVGDLTKLKELSSAAGKGKSKDKDSFLFDIDNNETATPDVILVDPARAGLSAELVTAIRKIAPPRIVYVSCNPVTQARDFYRFFGNEDESGKHGSAKRGSSFGHRYKLQSCTPIDLFPNTPHVETVAVLLRVDDGSA